MLQESMRVMLIPILEGRYSTTELPGCLPPNSDLPNTFFTADLEWIWIICYSARMSMAVSKNKKKVENLLGEGDTYLFPQKTWWL